MHALIHPTSAISVHTRICPAASPAHPVASSLERRQKYSSPPPGARPGSTAGIVPCGTTGENPTLTEEEIGKIFEVCVKAANKRCQVGITAASSIYQSLPPPSRSLIFRLGFPLNCLPCRSWLVPAATAPRRPLPWRRRPRLLDATPSSPSSHTTTSPPRCQGCRV